MSETSGAPLAELKAMVSDQKQINLPVQAGDPSLTRLHRAVTDYDRVVTQRVISLIQGLTSDVTPEQIRELEAAVSHLLATPELVDNRKGDFYLTYKARLDRMAVLAEQVEGSS